MIMGSHMSHMVALTGATGFVGSHLLDLLVDTGHDVRALTRRPQSAPTGVTWIEGSLEDTAALKALTEGSDAVVHVARVIKGLTRYDFMAANHDATGKLLNTINGLKTEFRPTRFVLVSSIAAREPQLSHYSESKRAGEDALLSLARDLDWTILRPPAVYGPGDFERLKIFKAIMMGVVPILGRGRDLFSLIHVHDLARAIVHVLGHEDSFGQTLELDDGRHGGYCIDDILAVAERLLGKKAYHLPLPYIAASMAGHLNGLIATVTRRPHIFTGPKARELAHTDWVAHEPTLTAVTGWAPSLPIREGFEGTLNWYKDHGLL